MTGFQITLAAFSFALILVFGGVWVFQTYGLYRFDATPQVPETLGLTGVRVVNFVSEDGAAVQAWLSVPAPGRPVLFSFYGNFSAIGPSMRRLLPLTADGTGIVMLHYRGAGGMPGQPSEENFARDARALYDQLDVWAGQTIAPNRRFVHGFSLGTGVAARLATERPFAGLVIEASMPRLCLYFQRRYHGVPLCALMWAERYETIARIGAVGAPKLFVHGAKDRAVPLIWGQQLFAAATEPKRFVTLPDGAHADLAQHGLMAHLQAFLARPGD